MQQFALASVYPRSIAWLIRFNEWDRFEKIISYNCAMIGGYFNVFIPLLEHDAISDVYQRFLADYDPDLIVLAPGMASDQLETSLHHIQPFGVIPWDLVSKIATLDPLSHVNGMNATTSEVCSQFLTKPIGYSEAFVAVANAQYPDTSRLALVACGDIEPRKPMIDVMDGEVSLDATGYREHFLERLLIDKYNQKYAGAYIEDEAIVPAPDRYQLSKIISEKYQFPLSGVVKILNVCFRLQNHAINSARQTFVNLTSTYHKVGGTSLSKNRTNYKCSSALVILVSNHFSLSEALLFWNLRANTSYVAWLPFEELEKDQDALMKWLESDYGGTFYEMISGSGITFATLDGDTSRLQTIVDDLRNKRTRAFTEWKVTEYQNLICYNSIRLPILSERVAVMKDGLKYVFMPKLPQESRLEIFTTTLEWNGCMLPRYKQIIQKGVSQETIKSFSLKEEASQLLLPRFRTTNERYLKAQIDNEKPLEFHKPSPEQIVQVLFGAANFTRIEQSSAARYHTIFINRAGGLEEAAHYLAMPPYRELLEILSNNNPKNKIGWLLTNPSKRRALHHLFLRDALGKLTTDKTREYFNTVSDELPIEAFHLLEKGLLERGFLLKCRSCSFHSWYPAEHIGQTFECARCFQTQTYASNPLWLYKLPEVIFQGFEDNMQVPILTLSYFKRIRQHYFEWVPDSNVYQQVNGVEVYRNLDLLIICDGKFYIGEAKSNNEIDAEQFSFYEEICRRVAIDGIVFATSQPGWSRATQHRIDRLKTQFTGEVLVLTEKDLYVNTATN